MASTPLKLFSTPAAADLAADAAEGALEDRAGYPTGWQRGRWWLSLLVLIPICWGVLQMLALLIQTERLRTALEAGLQVTQLPESNLTQVEQRIQFAMEGMNLEQAPNHAPANRMLEFPGSYSLSFLLDGTATQPDRHTLHQGEVVEVVLMANGNTLLPAWLGPQLPGVGSDVVRVRWRAVVRHPQ